MAEGSFSFVTTHLRNLGSYSPMGGQGTGNPPQKTLKAPQQYWGLLILSSLMITMQIGGSQVLKIGSHEL